MRAVSLMISLVLFNACSQTNCRETPIAEPPEVKIKIERIDQQIFSATNAKEIENILTENPILSNQFLHADQYPELSILSEKIWRLTNDPFIDTLFNEASDKFNQPLFLSQMNQAMSWLTYYFPETNPPKVQTITTGLYNDMLVTDNTLIIGLDYFIGTDATYRPTDLPQYILNRYTHEYLVPTVMKFYVNRYVQYGKENTLLSEMIDYGKLYYFLSKLMPCTPDYKIIGFTSQEVVDVEAYQEVIWASLLENEVLYSTEEFMKRKFLGERPKVFEIGEKCPGRIGAWVGWKIVDSYMTRYPKTTMQELLADIDHHKLFSESGYKPKNVRQ